MSDKEKNSNLESLELDRKPSMNDSRILDNLRAQIKGLMLSNKNLEIEKQKLILLNGQLAHKVSRSSNLASETLDVLIKESFILLGVFSCFLYLGELVLSRELFNMVFCWSLILLFLAIVLKARLQSRKNMERSKKFGTLTDEIISEYLTRLKHIMKENEQLQLKLLMKSNSTTTSAIKSQIRSPPLQMGSTLSHIRSPPSQIQAPALQVQSLPIEKIYLAKEIKDEPIEKQPLPEKVAALESEIKKDENQDKMITPQRITPEPKTIESSETQTESFNNERERTGRTLETQGATLKRDLTPCKTCKPIDTGEIEVYRVQKSKNYHISTCILIKGSVDITEIKLKQCFSLSLTPCKFCKPPEIQDGSFVYITNTGKKYHKDGCEHLEKSKIPIKLKEIG